ncbi:MAG: ribosome maturation factor RimM [Candidatus Magnetominusculus sp. LBB02]|nr:ribosome maturation factor RimM [Candidatus Magnetominusculus sp. LBB02]
MKAVLAADMSEGMFMPVNAVVLSGGAALNIASKTFRHDCVILKFDGIDTPEEAALYNNMTMEAEGVEMPPLEDGQYYIEDIIGLDVIAASGEALGKVSDVLSFPANDVYVMQYAERECLIPAIADVIKEINIVGGYIKINVIEGLL